MPKPLYGGNKNRSKRGNDSGPLRGDDVGSSSGEWLTFSRDTAVSEEEKFDATLEALMEAVAALDPARYDAPSGTREAVAGAFVEAATTRADLDCEASWVELLQEVVEEDASIPLGCDDEEDSVDGARRVIGALLKLRVLCRRPPAAPPLVPGDEVLAVLAEDGAWHQGVIEPPDAGSAPTLASASGSAARGTTVLVRFVEWGNVQRTAAREVTRLASAVDDDDDDADAGGGGGRARQGECEMCGRGTRLTYHHLVPKETHHRYLGKYLPQGLADEVPTAEPTRIFLNSHGALLCRPCHTTVHRFAPNGVLAARFHTIERLLAPEPLQRWAKYAAKSLKR